MGTLYVVATPIGNLADITDRAREVLRTVVTVVAEDTRRSRKLLAVLGSNARVESFHAHSPPGKLSQVIALLDRGDVAYVTDAGTPGVSDPGARLVAAARREGHTVSPVPGPSALTAALSISGLETGGAVFLGFLPARRRRRLQALEGASRTDLPAVVFSSARTAKRILQESLPYFGEGTPVVVCRELTKLHEEIVESTLSAAPALDVVSKQRGEYVLVIGRRQLSPDEVDDDRLAAEMELEQASGASVRDASESVARKFGVSRRQAYSAGLSTQPKD
ncbi:MAG: 16S rRNA (cytidine(1402)-2'-O)-methyltransferase [Chloroflexi bacterium]|nr:16S rRNA (cytidine(1402)-2'-O)-methyltransferase [Chloroflexota bacterium]